MFDPIAERAAEAEAERQRVVTLLTEQNGLLEQLAAKPEKVLSPDEKRKTALAEMMKPTQINAMGDSLKAHFGSR